jgi:hypothetical protein
MHGLVASAFFSVMLLAAALMLGLPSQRVGQAGAGEGDQLPPVESTQSPAAIPSNGAASVARICDALAAAAGENDLPVDFFARLIWQESRFDPTASASRRARRGTVHAGDRERARHRQVAGIPGVGEIATDYEPASSLLSSSCGRLGGCDGWWFWPRSGQRPGSYLGRIRSELA